MNDMKKPAFTLAESAAHAGFGNDHRRCAFTLAETLITLMVIGVVAALTIPALMQQIGDYTLQKQKDVFSKKWQEGLRQMRVDGKLETSYTTEEFVNEMGKYFKIASVCNSDNLTGCFTEKITSYENGEAEEFEVKDLKSAKNFNKSEQDAPVYGIRFTDGTSMLLAYKKDCKGISEGDTRGNHTQCILYVYDVNSNKSPNSYGGNTGVDAKDGENKMSDNKRNEINKGRDLVGNVSITKGNPFGLSFKIAEIFYDSGTIPEFSTTQEAENYCATKGNSLPTKEQLKEIAEKIYKDECKLQTFTYNDYYDCECDGTVENNPLYQKICNSMASDYCYSVELFGADENSSWQYTANGFTGYSVGNDIRRKTILCVGDSDSSYYDEYNGYNDN